jgi:SEC-C motif
MNLLDLFRRSRHALPVTNRNKIISRYRRLRAACRDLNNSLVKRLSKDAMHVGGRKLGILRGDTFVFDTEDQTSVLMDYCLYDVRQKGRNIIEQYLMDSPPDPESDEMTCLRSMQQAIYSLFVVDSVEAGLGVSVRDLLSQEVFLVVDMGLGSTAQPGLVFASRLLHYDGFSMTGGAALPVAVLPADERDALTNNLSAATTPDDDGYFDPAPIIRACLSKGSSSRVQYQEPSGQAIRQQRIPNNIRSTPIGRNSPCPCGSGKKFKKCCIAHR